MIARANQAKENRELNFEEENLSAKHDSVDYEGDLAMLGCAPGINGKVNLFS